jgi:hypothetical protein
VTKNIAIIIMNLVTPKAGAKHEHLFNEPALAHLITTVKSFIRKIVLKGDRSGKGNEEVTAVSGKKKLFNKKTILASMRMFFSRCIRECYDSSKR